MGLQSGNLTAAGEHQSYYGSAAGLHDPFARESTDVLRRRAENLLDEMMLGAADIGGDYVTDYGSTGYTNGSAASIDSGTTSAAPPVANNGAFAESGASDYEFPGVSASAPRDLDAIMLDVAAVAGAQEIVTSGKSPLSGSGDARYSTGETGQAPRLVSAADRYATADKSGAPSRSDGASTGPVNGAVRRQSASTASTMTVGARASLRSTLLPRNSEVDANVAQHEIDVLLHEVAAVLPPGHEATERSRHLLSKAQTILHSDQSRSAEIEYYLQQVRRILERTQQRKAWSDLYRSRLWTYLVSWTLLALVVLTGIALYRSEFAFLLVASTGASPEAPWIIFAGMTLAAACAGALGAIVGVYAGIARRQRTEHGYFDRKYGLRGLLMPLFGFFFGSLIAIVTATLFHFVGVEPNQSALILIPIVIAFAVGLGQESLYGAR